MPLNFIIKAELYTAFFRKNINLRSRNNQLYRMFLSESNNGNKKRKDEEDMFHFKRTFLLFYRAIPHKELFFTIDGFSPIRWHRSRAKSSFLEKSPKGETVMDLIALFGSRVINNFRGFPPIISKLSQLSATKAARYSFSSLNAGCFTKQEESAR